LCLPGAFQAKHLNACHVILKLGKMKPFVLLLFVTVACAQERPLRMNVTRGRFVTVTGKWKGTTGRQGDEVAYKHAVQIDCFKAQDTCMVATANIVGSEPDITVEYYDVIRWDENGVVAENKEPICVTNQLNISFQDQSVMAIDSPKLNAKGFKDSCKVVGHTLTYRLIGR
jgi:hypothetical protein